MCFDIIYYICILVKTEGGAMKKDFSSLSYDAKPCDNKNSVKKVTGRILRMDGNGFNMSVAVLICLLFIVIPFIAAMLPSYMFSFEDEEGVMRTYGIGVLMSIALLLGGWVFAALPCIGGYAFFANEVVDGKEHSFGGIFSVFVKTKNYLGWEANASLFL